MTVWVVTSGEYSDYQVEAIFSAKELAQEYVDTIRAEYKRLNEKLWTCFHDPEEWELDPKDGQWIKQGRKAFEVYMLRDGTTDKVAETTPPIDNMLHCSVWYRSKFPSYRDSGVKDCLHVRCYATDAKHAVKIANEKRTQMIAYGDWPEDESELARKENK